MSFGKKGSLLFSSLNVLQLVGWTAVMIVSGATAASAILSLGGDWVWCIIIGVLITAWILIGLKNLSKVNVIAMGALFLLTLVMSTIIFRDHTATVTTEVLSFGAAVELSVAMPLSWLPLISDYTRTAKKPFAATLTSSIVYFFVSSWMYVIGLGAAIYTGEGDVASIMMKAGFGIIALIIIIFSTVTTTFLDAYSSGVSMVSISPRFQEKSSAIVVCIIGVLLAILTSISQFEEFLYLIGSVFAPMIAIQIADYFTLRKDVSAHTVDWTNLVLWLIGFILYRIFLRLDTPVGNTFPVMLITYVLCLITHAFLGKKRNS